jgi:signal transduction histidine kinase
VGLTVARGIVERHEGELGVSSQPGKGSVFTVRLPSLAAQLEEA